MTNNFHGGDIYNNRVEYDFSVNINPLGAPKSILNAIKLATSEIGNYPDYEVNKLKSRLAQIINVSKEQIIMTAGASQAFMAICHSRRYKNAIVEAPSFYGYEYALNAIHSNILHLSRTNILKGDYASDIDAIFLANPNNPSGLMFSKNQLFSIISTAKERNVDVILDECFLQLSDRPEDSFIQYMTQNPNQFNNLLVVRSFTKTFAMPDIRLGYIVTSGNFDSSDIKMQLPEWNISSMAQKAGLAALENIDEVKKAREVIIEERFFLEEQLKRLGFPFQPSKANFILFKGPQNLYKKLLTQKILIRDCSNYVGCSNGEYRIAIKQHEANMALIKALEQINE